MTSNRYNGNGRANVAQRKSIAESAASVGVSQLQTELSQYDVV